MTNSPIGDHYDILCLPGLCRSGSSSSMSAGFWERVLVLLNAALCPFVAGLMSFLSNEHICTYVRRMVAKKTSQIFIRTT